MSDTEELRKFAMAQFSCLDDYRQRLTLCRQYLGQLMHERTKYDHQVTSSERVLQDYRQRLSSKQERLANLQMLRQQVQMKMSMAATLGKLA